jgi:phospholipid transport system substrate-binding protein
MLRDSRVPTPARFIAKVLFVLSLVALSIAGRASEPQAATKAGTFIQSLANQAVSALTAEGVSREQKEARARQLLSEYFAVDTIGRWVLGRYWQQATPAEREDYLKLFKDLIVTTYVDRFSRYSGETLSVTRTASSDSSEDVIVFSQITRPSGGQPVEVAWRVRDRDNALKIVDVYVEGVSMGQTQRSEFASVIRNSDGKVSGLLDEMRRRIKRDA